MYTTGDKIKQIIFLIIPVVVWFLIFRFLNTTKFLEITNIKEKLFYITAYVQNIFSVFIAFTLGLTILLAILVRKYLLGIIGFSMILSAIIVFLLIVSGIMKFEYNPEVHNVDRIYFWLRLIVCSVLGIYTEYKMIDKLDPYMF